jgi:hypothetical protein
MYGVIGPLAVIGAYAAWRSTEFHRTIRSASVGAIRYADDVLQAVPYFPGARFGLTENASKATSSAEPVLWPAVTPI